MTAADPTTRLTLSLPTSLVDALDQFLAKDSSRSAAVRAVLEKAVEEARRREQVERFVRGYNAAPQTEEEFGWADAVALDAGTERSSS